MAAAIDPITLSQMDEIRNLKAEIGFLKEEMASMREDFAFQMAQDRKRIRQLEGAKIANSRLVYRHLDILTAWLRDHPDRKGITYDEAAKLLNVTTERISQLKPTIEADDRLCIAKTKGRYRKKYISLR